eukprot:jgi/Ulvmu1/4646/UM002_0377.1
MMLRTRSTRFFLSTVGGHGVGQVFGASSVSSKEVKPSSHNDVIKERQRLLCALAAAGRERPPLLPSIAWTKGFSHVGGKDTTADQADTPKDISWIERVAPACLLPYVHLARLHKPIGSWLLAWPCFWSIAMAAAPGHLPDLHLLSLYGTGAVLLRGAGCTINDMWDRKVDAQVERTKYRPMAVGKVSMPQATAFLALQLGLGLVILLQLNPSSQILGVASLPLVAVYPLMKRITNLPQAFLGLTINWGAVMGWASVRGSCDWPVVMPLYVSAICWTLIYDTIYAHMDKADDTQAGVRSTALYFSHKTKPILFGLAVGMGCLQGVSGLALGAGPAYYIGVSAGIAHVMWQIHDVDLDVPASCLQKFKSNAGMGALPMAGFVLDRLWST